MIECDYCGHGIGLHRESLEYVGRDSFDKRAIRSCKYLQGVTGGFFSREIFCGCLCGDDPTGLAGSQTV